MSKKNNNPLFKPIVFVAKYVGRNFPEILVGIRYFVRFKKVLQLNIPKTLNEKILYLSLKTDTTEWTRLADKYHVREYIKECDLDDILVKCYGYWKKAIDVDFSKLPNSFVLKTVQGSGDIILIKDKSNLNIEETKRHINIAVNTRYGELEGGKHYMRIPPAIIAEELLFNDENSQIYSTSIIDYKIWCFNGKAHFIWVCCNRSKDGVDVMTYDLEWNAHPEYSVFTNHYRKGNIIPKPQNLEKMINVAEKLAMPFPVVRVDLYNIDGVIYFGEMTFTSLGGLMDYFSDEFQSLAGSMIDINYKS